MFCLAVVSGDSFIDPQGHVGPPGRCCKVMGDQTPCNYIGDEDLGRLLSPLHAIAIFGPLSLFFFRCSQPNLPPRFAQAELLGPILRTEPSLIWIGTLLFGYCLQKVLAPSLHPRGYVLFSAAVEPIWQEDPPSTGTEAFFQHPGVVQHKGWFPRRGLSISELFICPHLLLELQPIHEHVHAGLARTGPVFRSLLPGSEIWAKAWGHLGQDLLLQNIDSLIPDLLLLPGHSFVPLR